MRLALITPVAVVLALSACMDDNQLSLPDEEDLEEQSGGLAAYEAPEDSVEGYDPWDHRVRFTITSNDLSPGSDIVLRIKGEAQETVNGGSVVLTLPTQARLSSDSLPDVGVAMPEQEQWTLPSMDKGDVWEQTATVPSAVAGYYLAGLSAETTGPAAGPYMADTTYSQAWMYVSDNGSQTTEFFDESIFPEGTLPMPGPFVLGQDDTELAEGWADDPSDDPVDLAHHRDRIRIRVLYYHGKGQGYKPAVGARVHGSMGRSGFIYTVPEDGRLSISCPPHGQRWRGRVHLPNTPFVDGKSNFVRYWAFSRDHCGKSFLLIGSRVNYLPWRYLHLSAINIISHFGHSRGRVHWKVDWNKGKSYYYSWLWFNKIVLNKYGYDHPWIVAHEYTHALHDKGLGGRWKVRNCSPHYLDSISSYTCAFSEGLADYGGVIGSGGDFRRYFEEFDNAEPGVKGKIEGHVAALFMDLIDDEE